MLFYQIDREVFGFQPTASQPLVVLIGSGSDVARLDAGDEPLGLSPWFLCAGGTERGQTICSRGGRCTVLRCAPKQAQLSSQSLLILSSGSGHKQRPLVSEDPEWTGRKGSRLLRTVGGIFHFCINRVSVSEAIDRWKNVTPRKCLRITVSCIDGKRID